MFRVSTRTALASSLLLSLIILAAGCGSVAVSVEQPAGTRVEMFEKNKWFGAAGPTWCMGWDKVADQTVQGANPAELYFSTPTNWFTRTFTVFPDQYRAMIDLSKIQTFPNTPTSVVEVRYLQEGIPAEHQDVIRLWHEGRTLDALTNLPVEVLANVLYNLGDNWKNMLNREVPPSLQERAAQEFKTMLEAEKAPSPKEVESWLKSFLTTEQLSQMLGWIRNGVTLKDVRWVRLGGEPKHKDLPIFWRAVKGFLELFIRQPEIRSVKINFFEDIIIRDLMATRVETKLVNLDALKFYAEVKTFETTYYSDRVMPALELIQDIGVCEIVRPTADEEESLKRYGMTRTRKFEQPDRAQTIRKGLPPMALDPTLITTVRSQVLGAILDNQLAYVIIWNNPKTSDPERFITTVVTTDPYGMARVWAVKGNQRIAEAYKPFDRTNAPVGRLVEWTVSALDQRSFFTDIERPVAVFAFGNRRIEPWNGKRHDPSTSVPPMRELEPEKEAEVEAAPQE